MEKTSKSIRPVDAPFYRYWHALFMSFYSGKLYVDVSKRWKGGSYLYLLFMVTLFSLPFSLGMIANINHTMQDKIFDPLLKIPQLTIQQGQIQLDKPMPYLIKDSEGENVLAIDTTGTITNLDSAAYPNLVMLMTTNQFFYRIPSTLGIYPNNTKSPSGIGYSKVYTETFPKTLNEVFEGRDWIQGTKLKRMLIYIDLIMIPSIIMVFYAIVVMFSFLLTLLGQFISKLFMKFSLSFLQAARLVSVAITPISGLVFIALPFGYLPQYTGFIAIVSFIFYFCFGVFNLKAESGKLVL